MSNRPFRLIVGSLGLIGILAGPCAAQDSTASTDAPAFDPCAEYYGCIEYGPWPPRSVTDARTVTQPRTAAEDTARRGFEGRPDQPTVIARPAAVDRFTEGARRALP
jgi:hypothetical protein